MTKVFLSVTLLFACCSAFASEYGKVTTTKVADRVYQFSVSEYGDVGMSGNSIAVIGTDGVLIFDTTGTPASTRLVIAELKKITKQPVRYVVNSHWHWDHTGGNQAFKAAYPKAEIISQEKTRAMMQRDAVEWNRDYLATVIPDHIKELEAAAKKANSPAQRAQLNELAAADRDFLRQKKLKNVFADHDFTDSLRLLLGDREIQLFHARAITPGDTFAYLPKEKILLSGDILVHPIPFAIGGTYPESWIETLERLKSLDPAIIIPGHGPAETDQKFLDANLLLFQTVQRDVKHAKSIGLTLEQTMERLGSKAGDYAAIIDLHGESIGSFKGYFLNGFVKNSYLELEHPLSDTPMR